MYYVKDSNKNAKSNEQVKDGVCERCGTTVTKRALPQWYFAITKYADELLDFGGLDWPEKIKTMQRNWIGRSTGTTIGFDVSEFAPGEQIGTFTTRIDTVYGVTFVVLAPEHPLVKKLTQPAQKADGHGFRKGRGRRNGSHYH